MIIIIVQVVAASPELWGIFQPYAHLSSCRTAKVSFYHHQHWSVKSWLWSWWWSSSLWWSWIWWSSLQGSLTVPKCLNVATTDGVRLTATVKSLEKSLTQVISMMIMTIIILILIIKSLSFTFLFPRCCWRPVLGRRRSWRCWWRRQASSTQSIINTQDPQHLQRYLY